MDIIYNVERWNMAKGSLVVDVYSGSIANPIRNATVQIFQNGKEIDTKFTDENGKTEAFLLDTVDQSYSQENQKETRPYETYDIKVSALGLTDTIVEGVPIFDGVTSMQSIYMTTVDENEKEDITELPPNTLWGDYPPYLSQTAEGGANTPAPILLPRVFVPENIIVHDGVPSNTNAPNYTVPFVDYIKNVASSEIYSTWPEETIRANILAIISFTLNRIYTEWYRTKGYDFTITSTTSYDQKYTRNGTIYEPISRIVDEIFTEYIRKGIRIEPLLAPYRDETSEEGVLSQWGSKELGDKGYRALDILRYYYGEDVNLFEAEITQSYPYSFTTTLKEGDCSNDVYLLQNALNYIRGSYPGIPMIENPDGSFDSQTERAVRTFQTIFSLSPTGEVNYQTWYKISYLLTAVSQMTQSVYN